MPDLSKVSQRERLKSAREPYWHRLKPGCFVGYRPSVKGGAGTWVARAYDEERRSYRLKALGAFTDHPASARFAAAKQASEEFAALVEGGAIAQLNLETVTDACREFGKTRPEAEQRFCRLIYSDPLGKVKLAKLRRWHVAGWRDRLANTPALVSRRKTGTPITRPRSPASVNRDMAVLRTALGQVVALGPPNTDAAWQEALKPIKNAVKRRTLYLNLAERRALVEAVVPEAQAFVRVLCMLPLRPGAIAALTVADFDRHTSELTVGKDKAGNGRRIVVPASVARLLVAASKDKLPSAALFTRNNGKQWDSNSWKFPIREAAHEADLPPGVTAYTLRHSVITDLVASGLPLLTVGQISGTSAEMIERHYGHLLRHAALDALEGLSL
jgi:integrase